MGKVHSSKTLYIPIDHLQKHVALLDMTPLGGHRDKHANCHKPFPFKMYVDTVPNTKMAMENPPFEDVFFFE